MRLFALALACVVVALPAKADYTLLDSTGATKTFKGTVDSGSVNAPSVGGFGTGTVPTVNATVAAATHAIGESVGGLFSVPVARTAGGSGIINTINWISANGDTTQKQVRVWDKNPTGTTCTDHAAFVSAAADDVHLLTLPLTMTPLAPVNTTGDAKTYASLTGLVLNFKNQDSSATVNVYVCVVTVAADTLDNNTKVYLTLSGIQD